MAHLAAVAHYTALARAAASMHFARADVRDATIEAWLAERPMSWLKVAAP